MKFTSEISEQIGYYVYMYSDPDSGKPFYVGKGKGNRAFQDINDAKSEKAKLIKDIKNRGKSPTIELLRYGLTEAQASLLEASIIDLIGLTNLSNKVRGEHSRSFGRTSVEDIILELSAKRIEILKEHKIICITINKLYRSGISKEELYECTRGIWKVGEKRNKVKYAFSLFRGIVREVYEIDKWHKAGTQEYKYRDSTNFKQSGRWEFEGRIASDDIRNMYRGKSVRNYLNKGSQNPIRYLS